jgi:glutathione synthase/RimK-type ligase-like ATP-grasp enzyme
MPVTLRLPRSALEGLTTQAMFPVIVRPVDSHAGQGLEKIQNNAELADYLANRSNNEFYLSSFIDYRNSDGLFRKYRIVLIKGKPFLCHLAISEHWMIHYLNAGMSESADKRAEEAQVMVSFDDNFAARHAQAFSEINERVGLDYLGIDCGETPDGKLLIFEIDSCMIVHAMDSEALYPYKQPQMHKVFSAFQDMLINELIL